MEKIYKPYNDVVFQMIFGSNCNKHLTDAFIKSVLKNEKEELKLGDLKIESEVPIEKMNVSDKGVRLDVIAEYDNTIVCIEMQNRKCSNIYQRARCYAAKVGAAQLKAGEDYENLKPLVMICILNHKPDDKCNTRCIEHIITVKDEERNEYVKMGINFIFIYLGNVTNSNVFSKEDEFLNWCRFIKYENKEVIDMISVTNENIKLANDELQKLNDNEIARRIARFQELAELERALDRAEGKAEGRVEGRVEGEANGIIKGRTEIVERMLINDYSIEQISTLTGLSEAEILEIAENIKCPV